MDRKELIKAISMADYNRSSLYSASSAEIIRLVAKFGLDLSTFLVIMGTSMNKVSKMTTDEKIRMVVKYITGELDTLD